MNNINDYVVPFKDDKEIPCFHYDIAHYCKLIKDIMPTPFPKYLCDYGELITDYSKQIKKVTPKFFPNAYRVYIIDYRLNVLFASLDTSGKIATSFSKYGKFGFRTEDYYYGIGESIGGVFHGFNHDRIKLMSFLSDFGFLPIEELSMSAALIYNGAEIEERVKLSQYQVLALMERFRKNNFISWKQRIDNTKSLHPYF